MHIEGGENLYISSEFVPISESTEKIKMAAAWSWDSISFLWQRVGFVPKHHLVFAGLPGR